MSYDVEDGLPTGWAWTTLGDVTSSHIDQGGPEGDEFLYVDIGGIDNRTKRIVGLKRLRSAQAPSRARQRLQPLDVLVSMTRPNLNAVALIPQSLSAAVGSTGFHVLRGSRIEPRWLFYLVQTPAFVEDMSHVVQGALYPAVRPKDITRYRIPVAPLPEQGRVVSEIEKQLTQLDAGMAALQRVRANLKRYRASVLKAAVEGRLVPTEAELARAEGRSYKPHDQLLRWRSGGYPASSRKRGGRLWGAGVVPGLTDDERKRLPDGWAWVKVRDLGAGPQDTVQVGPMSMRSEDFCESGVPVFNVGCVGWGIFNENKLNFLPEAKASSFARYRISPGDVLFTRSGTVGRCAVAKDYHADWLMTFHLLRVRPDPNKCLPHFLRIVFEGAPHIRRQAREASIGTTRAGFNTNLLAMLDVPFPPVEEQHRIVEEVEARLSFINQVADVLNVSLRRAGRLRQAILQQAFEGKLVPQDPSDEPASALLERIRKETAATTDAATMGECERRSGRGRRGTMSDAKAKGAAR